MFFLQAAESPVIVMYGDRKLTVPKFTMDDVVAWGAEIMSQDMERLTESMPENQLKQHLTLYPPLPPDLQEMKRRLRTVEGMQRVLKNCLSQAKVRQKDGNQEMSALTEEEISELIRLNGTGRCAVIAWELADLDESRERLLPPPKTPSGEEDDETDPMKKSGNSESGGSPATGAKRSRSGQQLTQVSTGGSAL